MKVKSLKLEVRRIISLIFTLQETHFYRKGRVKIDDFKIFEAIHMKEHYRAQVNIQMVLMIEQLLVVQVKGKNKELTVITGYGPQENLSIKERMPLIIPMDANSRSKRNKQKLYILYQ